MDKTQFLEILRQRDALIDILILSHLKTLGRMYSLESNDAMKQAGDMIVDYYAEEYIIEEKVNNETMAVMEMEITTDRKIKYLSQIDSRTKSLSRMLKEMSASIRVRTLKQMNQ
jgi:hypothetical protein